MKKIIINILPDGSLNIEADGFEDSTCLTALKELEKHIGTVSDLKFKPEAHKVPVNQSHNRVKS
jgi:hypothetical protein